MRGGFPLTWIKVTGPGPAIGSTTPANLRERRMPTDAYLRHLESQLADVDAKLARARTSIDAGRPADRAKALEDWSELRIRHKNLASRIETAKREGAETWSALHTSFREEADALADTLERWLTKLS
jgi:hypothetical protein